MARPKKTTKEPEIESLRLAALSAGMRGLTPTSGANHAEAAAVCLEERGHGITCLLLVTGNFNTRFLLTRAEVDDQARNSRGDAERATEDGACGLAFLLVSRLTNLEVLRQSRKGTGFDYALVPRDSFLFRDCVRLEVTGIRQDDSGKEIKRRVQQRRERFEKFGDQGIPAALIVVVEFGRPVVHIVRL